MARTEINEGLQDALQLLFPSQGNRSLARQFRFMNLINTLIPRVTQTVELSLTSTPTPSPQNTLLLYVQNFLA